MVPPSLDTPEPEQPTTTPIESTTEPPLITATEEPVTPTPVEKPPADASEAERMAWYFEKLRAAADAENLLPAEQAGTATYWLVEMIRKSPDHELITPARSYIAKTHTELARQARLAGLWDTVQFHLDAAMQVNLPFTYRDQ
jgi:hypothetical protein